MAGKTKGQLEAEITKAMVKFEREYMGRGPIEARTYIIDDVILVRLKGVLTLAEQQLASDPENRALVKQVRARLLECARPLLETVIAETTGGRVISMHSDVSTKTGERIILFVMATSLGDLLEDKKGRRRVSASRSSLEQMVEGG